MLVRQPGQLELTGRTLALHFRRGSDRLQDVASLQQLRLLNIQDKSQTEAGNWCCGSRGNKWRFCTLQCKLNTLSHLTFETN